MCELIFKTVRGEVATTNRIMTVGRDDNILPCGFDKINPGSPAIKFLWKTVQANASFTARPRIAAVDDTQSPHVAQNLKALQRSDAASDVTNQKTPAFSKTRLTQSVQGQGVLICSRSTVARAGTRQSGNGRTKRYRRMS